jgi:hypothetical protein
MRRIELLLLTAVMASPIAAQPKNVQHLGSLTPTQLQRTMNMISSSLGKGCDYCHVVSEKDGWNFASDDKPEKKRGREMIAMTIDLNQKFFHGRPVVSCNTCHRGSTLPVSLVPLPQALLPFPTPAEEKPALAEAKDVIARYAAAIGETSKFHSFVMKGTRENAQGKVAPIEVTQGPGSAARVLTMTPDGEQENILDGQGGGTVRTPKEAVRPARPGEVEHFGQLAEAFAFVLPSDIPADAKVVRKEGEQWIVANDLRPGVHQRLYFDAKTGLLTRRMITFDSPIGRVPQETEYSDYRDAGGVKLPFTIRTSFADPRIGSIRRYAEVKGKE